MSSKLSNPAPDLHLARSHLPSLSLHLHLNRIREPAWRSDQTLAKQLSVESTPPAMPKERSHFRQQAVRLESPEQDPRP